MESLYLKAGLEYLLEELLNTSQEEGSYEKNVREVLGKPCQGCMGAVGLHIVDMIVWI